MFQLSFLFFFIGRNEMSSEKFECLESETLLNETICMNTCQTLNLVQVSEQ